MTPEAGGFIEYKVNLSASGTISGASIRTLEKEKNKQGDQNKAFCINHNRHGREKCDSVHASIEMKKTPRVTSTRSQLTRLFIVLTRNAFPTYHASLNPLY